MEDLCTSTCSPNSPQQPALSILNHVSPHITAGADADADSEDQGSNSEDENTIVTAKPKLLATIKTGSPEQAKLALQMLSEVSANDSWAQVVRLRNSLALRARLLRTTDEAREAKVMAAQPVT